MKNRAIYTLIIGLFSCFAFSQNTVEKFKADSLNTIKPNEKQEKKSTEKHQKYAPEEFYILNDKPVDRKTYLKSIEGKSRYK